MSRGYGFLTFTKSDDARRAIEQLNGFEIAGRPMKVANVTDKTPGTGGTEYSMLDDIETKGVNMGASGETERVRESGGQRQNGNLIIFLNASRQTDGWVRVTIDRERS